MTITMTKQRKDMWIPEVLLENFCRSTVLAGGEHDVTPATAAVPIVVGGNLKEDTPPPPTTSSLRHQRVEGDVPTLSLYNNFFVEGVRIGWPFPEVKAANANRFVFLGFEFFAITFNRRIIDARL